MHPVKFVEPRELREKILSSNWLPEFFKVDKNQVMLNIGCGYGPQIIVFHNLVREIYAFDLNFVKVLKTMSLVRKHNLRGVYVCQLDAEKMSVFGDNLFDVAIAVNVIEHVENPEKMLKETSRVLKEGGRFLVTIPAAEEYYSDFFEFLRRIVDKGRLYGRWRERNQKKPVKEWLGLFEENGFKIETMRATTLFPPLHHIGIKKFWFKNKTIHEIDSLLSSLPLLKYLGQSLAVILKKI